jgi:hypothetical protein
MGLRADEIPCADRAVVIDIDCHAQVVPSIRRDEIPVELKRPSQVRR